MIEIKRKDHSEQKKIEKMTKQYHEMLQYFDKNAIFENYFLQCLYACNFDSHKCSKNICENRRIHVKHVKSLHKIQTVLRSKIIVC